MVEGAALEKQCASNGTEGSNPSLSAKENEKPLLTESNGASWVESVS